MRKLHTIYGLSSSENGKTRYIGQTIFSIERRKDEHVYESFHVLPEKRRYIHNWIKKVINSRFEILTEIIETNVEDWKTREIYWIKQYRDWGFDLVNLTDGGEGCPGYKWTEEQRKGIRGKDSPNWGKHPTKETRELQREIRKGYLEKHPGIMKGESNPFFGKGDLVKREKNHMWGKRGEETPFYNKHHTKETRELQSEKRKIYLKKHPDAIRGEKNYWYGKGDLMGGEKNPNAKIWKCISPEGEVFIVKNLPEFCREKGLSCVMMREVGNGRYEQHRGWRCECLGRRKDIKPQRPSDSDNKLKTIEEALDKAKQLAHQFNQDSSVNLDIWNKPMIV